LRRGVGLPVVVEGEVARAAFRALAVVQEARYVADGGVHPDVKVLGFATATSGTGNGKTEVGRVAGNVPVAQTRIEPFLQLARDTLVNVSGSVPALQAVLELAESEEEVLGVLLRRRRT